MAVLVRKYVTNGDKSNVTKSDLSEGLEYLGKTEGDIASRVKWLNMEDVFFKNTRDYIRIIN